MEDSSRHIPRISAAAGRLLVPGSSGLLPTRRSDHRPGFPAQAIDPSWNGIEVARHPAEWTVYPLAGYGEWFRRTLDLYIRETRGL